ncbi:saccharopine dehydrogenase C-terminal domain-containing protein [Vibrio artabrorum]|uniref:Saccharopine dehydrogenase C-terminal domain-containing protein n=1 Tax=Vibrio artabrorum TaxID=446374 RepID=A0ABT8CKG5_9VIBR|nr:saccharopine dehydrogenase C-terminal domain-containing protein [Vibrio artabrorum]MDN3701352.1 saccharopine dehydrogenase C-terminal domain-containing protein [Vibrio artabrorum]
MKKRIGLIGCGNLGYSIAYYIGKLGFDELYVHDLGKEKALKLKKQISEIFPLMHVEEGINSEKLDVVILSLSGPATIDFVTNPKNHSFFNGNKVFVSLGRPNYDDEARHRKLNSYLVENGITLLFGFGLEPGLVEILMNYLGWKHREDELESIYAVCGGVPKHPTNPLNYDLLFGDRLPALNRRALFKLNSELSHCNRFDISEKRFVEGVGMLEVYHDGLSPYLLSSPYIQKIPNIKQQTGRWPGFFNCMQVLINLGLLDENKTLACEATPSDLTHSILKRSGNLKYNKPDISFVEVSCQVTSGEHSIISVISSFDEKINLTGMAQMTSFMATWTAWLVSHQTDVCEPGLMLSHEYIKGDKTCDLLESFNKHLNCVVRFS